MYSKPISRLSIILFLALLSPCLAIEAAERCGWHVLNLQPTPVFYSNLPGSLPPNRTARAYWHPDLQYIYSTNQDGFRTTNGAAKDAARRVLCIGDSFTFGISVGDGETFPSRLQQLLNAEGKRDYQVINAGVSGMGIEDHLLYYLDKGRKLKPDVVVLQFNIFDLNMISTGVRYRSSLLHNPYERLRDDLLYGEMSRSLFKILDGSLAKPVVDVVAPPESRREGLVNDPAREWLPFGPLHVPDQVKALSQERRAILEEANMAMLHAMWGRYLETLKLLHDAVTADGADLLLVMVPDVMQLYAYINGPSAVLPAFCWANGIKYIDFNPLFRSMYLNDGGSPFLDPGDFHCSPLGNAYMAAAIRNRMAAGVGGALHFTDNTIQERYAAPRRVQLDVQPDGRITLGEGSGLTLRTVAMDDVAVWPGPGSVRILSASLKEHASGRMRLKFAADVPLSKVTTIFYPYLQADDRVRNVCEVGLSAAGVSSRFSTSQSKRPGAWGRMENEASLELAFDGQAQEFELELSFLGQGGLCFDGDHPGGKGRRLELLVYSLADGGVPSWLP